MYQKTLGGCFYGYIYMMELSTPFVCLRQILTHMQMKSSCIYAINGVFMIVTFFWCRIRPIPYMLYVHAYSTQLSFVDIVYSMPFKCRLGLVLVLVPQCYWFLLMIRGAVNLVWRKPSIKSH